MLHLRRRHNNRNAAIKAGVAGAIIGATGAAIGITMTDKQKREKLMSKIGDAKKWSARKMNELKQPTQETSQRTTNGTEGTNQDVQGQDGQTNQGTDERTQ